MIGTLCYKDLQIVNSYKLKRQLVITDSPFSPSYIHRIVGDYKEYRVCSWYLLCPVVIVRHHSCCADFVVTKLINSFRQPLVPSHILRVVWLSHSTVPGYRFSILRLLGCKICFSSHVLDESNYDVGVSTCPSALCIGLWLGFGWNLLIFLHPRNW